mmetsp:Transcript_5289/g.8148  ORF Transcript_5289/g.8148 Transcript_5289/m.8148 type:complete len:99 (+) Transcript_5289:1188-1484(+)
MLVKCGAKNIGNSILKAAQMTLNNQRIKIQSFSMKLALEEMSSYFHASFSSLEELRLGESRQIPLRPPQHPRQNIFVPSYGFSRDCRHILFEIFPRRV